MPRSRPLTPRMIVDFCRVRLTGVLVDEELGRVSDYLIGLLDLVSFPPYRGKWIDWAQVAETAGINETTLRASRYQLQPIFDALSRAVAMSDATDPVRASAPTKKTQAVAVQQEVTQREKPRSRRGPAPKPIVELSGPFTTQWDDLPGFGEALNMHM